MSSRTAVCYCSLCKGEESQTLYKIRQHKKFYGTFFSSVAGPSLSKRSRVNSPQLSSDDSSDSESSEKDEPIPCERQFQINENYNSTDDEPSQEQSRSADEVRSKFVFTKFVSCYDHAEHFLFVLRDFNSLAEKAKRKFFIKSKISVVMIFIYTDSFLLVKCLFSYLSILLKAVFGIGLYCLQ